MVNQVAQIPADRLALPEYHLYLQALEAEKLSDVAEARKAFRRALSGRKAEAGINVPEKPDAEMEVYLNDPNPEVRETRAREHATLTLNHLKAGMSAA